MAACLQLPSTGHLAANLVCTQQDFAAGSCQDHVAVPAHLYGSPSPAPLYAMDQDMLHLALLYRCSVYKLCHMGVHRLTTPSPCSNLLTKAPMLVPKEVFQEWGGSRAFNRFVQKRGQQHPSQHADAHMLGGSVGGRLQGGAGASSSSGQQHTTGDCSNCGNGREDALQVGLLCTPRSPSPAA